MRSSLGCCNFAKEICRKCDDASVEIGRGVLKKRIRVWVESCEAANQIVCGNAILQPNRIANREIQTTPPRYQVASTTRLDDLSSLTPHKAKSVPYRLPQHRDLFDVAGNPRG